ncbi:uncharacterized protein LOC141937115 isoform X2 [Strix uralensis]|uniref:uncharacterized protein LOC141937115 isoform X2 n=1 Tax=Strix uralensis TaxID=36305 RepID=UPI003DA78E4D
MRKVCTPPPLQDTSHLNVHRLTEFETAPNLLLTAGLASKSRSMFTDGKESLHHIFEEADGELPQAAGLLAGKRTEGAQHPAHETLQTAPSLLCGHLKRLLACLQFSPTLRVICYNSVLVSAGIELIFLSWEGAQPECQAQTGHWSVPYPVTLCSGYKAELEAVVEATTGWLETYPVSHVTARNTILGLEERVLWRHGTPERIESDNGTHFRNNLIDAWAEEHGIEWVYHIPYHAPASGKIERYNGLLKTTLRAMGGGTFKHWDTHLTEATWLVNTRGSANRAGPAQSKLPHAVDGDKVPVMRMRDLLGKMVWVSPAPGKGKPIHGIVFAQGPGCTWWVMQEDGEVRCVPQGDLSLGENIL